MHSISINFAESFNFLIAHYRYNVRNSTTLKFAEANFNCKLKLIQDRARPKNYRLKIGKMGGLGDEDIFEIFSIIRVGGIGVVLIHSIQSFNTKHDKKKFPLFRRVRMNGGI